MAKNSVESKVKAAPKEALSLELLVRYERLQHDVHQASMLTQSLRVSFEEARASFEEASKEEARLQLELADARESLAKELTQPKAEADWVALDLKPSVRSTLLVFPDNSDIRLTELRDKIGLSEGAVNTRIASSLEAGVVERSSRGCYRLTETGRAIRSAM